MCKPIDWPLLITRLVDDADFKVAEIARLIDMSPANLSTIKSEAREPLKAWDQAITMLDLYLKNFEANTVPRIGDFDDRMVGND